MATASNNVAQSNMMTQFDPSMLWLAALQLQQFLPKEPANIRRALSNNEDDLYTPNKYSSIHDIKVPVGFKLVVDDSFHSTKRYNEDSPSLKSRPSQNTDDYEDLTSLKSRFRRRNLFEETEDTSSPSMFSSHLSYERRGSEEERPSSESSGKVRPALFSGRAADTRSEHATRSKISRIPDGKS